MPSDPLVATRATHHSQFASHCQHHEIASIIAPFPPIYRDQTGHCLVAAHSCPAIAPSESRERHRDEQNDLEPTESHNAPSTHPPFPFPRPATLRPPQPHISNGKYHPKHPVYRPCAASSWRPYRLDHSEPKDLSHGPIYLLHGLSSCTASSHFSLGEKDTPRVYTPKAPTHRGRRRSFSKTLYILRQDSRGLFASTTRLGEGEDWMRNAHPWGPSRDAMDGHARV